MTITEFLQEKGLEAIKSYNTSSIKIYKKDTGDLACELTGDELMKTADSKEETLKLIEKKLNL